MDAPLTVHPVTAGAAPAIDGLSTPTHRSRGGATASRLGQFVLELPDSSWLLLDAVLVAVGLSLGQRLVGAVSTGTMVEHIESWKAYLVFIGAFMLAGMVFGLYERETLWSRSRIVTRTMLTTVAAVVLAYAVIYVVLYAVVSRRMVGWGIGFYLAAGLSLRVGIGWLVHRVRRALLVVGSPELHASFREAQAQNLLSEYRLIGCTVGPDAGRRTSDPAGVLGTHDQLDRVCDEHHATDIVVGADSARDPAVMRAIVSCLHRGIRVTNESTFYEKVAGQILVDRLTPDWFLFADLKVCEGQSISLKRCVDMVAGLLGLVLSAPVWAIIAVLVKLDDGGPVFYSQDRVGRGGRIFRLYKFRSMRTDAENGASVWARPDDPRVTRVGRYLRKSRLDELPQLVNILRGHMSLVGPRPERPDLVERLKQVLPFYDERHLIKPGLTGWAQINYKYGASIEDARRKLQYDLYYLKHHCLELDVMILLRTLGTFLRGAC